MQLYEANNLHMLVLKLEQSKMQPSKVRTTRNTRSQLYY
jgi:hypothetical protein